MAPNPKISAAFRAMADIGINEHQVKPVLKKLLRLYDKKWELIEAENYRVLADAIFEEEDSKVVEEKKKCTSYDEEDMEEEPQLHQEPERPLKRHSRSHESSSRNKKSTNDDLEDGMEEEFPLPHEHERPLKRLRLRGHEGQISPSQNTCNPMSGGSSLIRPKLEVDELLDTRSPWQPQDIARSPESRAELQQPISPHLGFKKKGKQPVMSKPLAPQERSNQFSLQVASQGKSNASERSSHGVRSAETMVEPGIIFLPKRNVDTHQLVKPKDEPFTDDMFTNEMPRDEVPIAVILPGLSSKENSLLKNGATAKHNDQEPVASQEKESRRNDIQAPSDERRMDLELATIAEGSPCNVAAEESPCNLEVASSSLGEVKLSMSCNPAIGRPDIHMPTLDDILKLTEEKCLHSYKIIDPNFSLKKLLGHMCDSFLELVTNSDSESQDGSVNISPSIDALQKCAAWDAVGGNKETLCMPSCSSNGSVSIECPTAVTVPQVPRPLLSLNGADDCTQTCRRIVSNGFAEDDKEGELGDSRDLVVVQQCDLTPDDLRTIHDKNDITKGEERVRISWVNEMSSECPPSFFYISQSLVFQDGDVNFCLSGIGDESCCGTCFGDCLAASVCCACACQTGGEFAYTSEGLVKVDFLEECISMNRNPQQHRPFYCKNCPIERLKNDDCLEPCKGHLKRKFIKECWSKCGCHRQCGNRVVQRGLKYKLQVFLTSEGKGWGLRTLEDLPKGAFVCEYVGEILTSEELHARNIQSTRSGKRPYPVLLDADWGSKADLRNKEALCLDATNYGNVARFINHRCLDANLVEIPVEVETPDHHYYHLAFFTTRKVDALEELNWDYGIDFDDHDHPVKVFDCRCGSKFCRSMKRSNRSRSASMSR